MKNGEVEILVHKCWFSDLKEQPAQNDVTQNPSTLLMSFARNVFLVTVKVWMSFSVFRIYPALPLDLEIIHRSIVNQNVFSITEVFCCWSCLWNMQWNLIRNWDSKVALNRVLILPSSWIFTFWFESKGWCTEHIHTCGNKALRSFVCKS